MEIKVRAVGDNEEKSVQEVEQELLDKHESQLEGSGDEQPTVADSPESATPTRS